MGLRDESDLLSKQITDEPDDGVVAKAEFDQDSVPRLHGLIGDESLQLEKGISQAACCPHVFTCRPHSRICRVVVADAGRVSGQHRWRFVYYIRVVTCLLTDKLR